MRHVGHLPRIILCHVFRLTLPQRISLDLAKKYRHVTSVIQRLCVIARIRSSNEVEIKKGPGSNSAGQYLRTRKKTVAVYLKNITHLQKQTAPKKILPKLRATRSR